MFRRPNPETPPCPMETTDAALLFLLADTLADPSVVESVVLVRPWVLGAVSGAAPHGGFRRRLSDAFDLPEPDVARVLATLDDPARWLPALPGVSLFHVDAGPRLAGADVGFVRYAAGIDVPWHRHGEEEIMLVLEGAFVELPRHHVLPGDVLRSGPGSSHVLRTLPGQDCLAAIIVRGGVELDP